MPLSSNLLLMRAATSSQKIFDGRGTTSKRRQHQSIDIGSKVGFKVCACTLRSSDLQRLAKRPTSSQPDDTVSCMGTSVLLKSSSRGSLFARL